MDPTRVRPLDRAAGATLVAACLGWVVFRMARRLADGPYVDFEAFHLAARAVNAGEDVYLSGQGMYVYPPMLAACMAPLGHLPPAAAGWAWFALALTTTLLALRAWWGLIADALGLPDRARLPAVGLALAAWVEQVRREFETGQCDWLLLGPLALAAVALARRPVLAGLLVGFAVHVKYLPVVVVAWLAVRRRWAAVGAAVAGVVAWAVLPAAVVGWDRNLDYLGRAVAGLGKLVGVSAEGQPGAVFPLEYEYSVSVPSGAARVGRRLGVGRWLVVPATLLAVAASVAVAGWVYRRHGWSLWSRVGPGGRDAVAVLEWAGVLTGMLAFGPQTQNRHLFVLLPAVLLGMGLLVSRVEPAKVAVGLAAGVLGTALLGAPEEAAAGEVNWGFVGGGGVAVLAMYLVVLDVGLGRLAALHPLAPDRVRADAPAATGPSNAVAPGVT
jgi:hypothetical protein